MRIQKRTTMPSPGVGAAAGSIAAAAWLALHPLTRRVSGIDFDDTRLLGAINVAVVGAAGNSGYWVAPAARGHQVARRAPVCRQLLSDDASHGGARSAHLLEHGVES